MALYLLKDRLAPGQDIGGRKKKQKKKIPSYSGNFPSVSNSFYEIGIRQSRNKKWVLKGKNEPEVGLIKKIKQAGAKFKSEFCLHTSTSALIEYFRAPQQ